jgi:hypothetical protein
MGWPSLGPFLIPACRLFNQIVSIGLPVRQSVEPRFRRYQGTRVRADFARVGSLRAMNLVRSLGSSIAALWRRIAPTNARRVLVVSAVFAPLMALGAYRVLQPAPPAAKPAAPAADTRPTDPVARFAETGIGHVLFWPHGSDTCRRVLFNNRTGASQEVGEVLCEPDKSDETVRAEINRLTTLRKAFKK